ncbi:MAG: LytR C-terminal domain-containing protein [Acidimicrobiales bacterium]|nr:LytR C-terminal domain-containing protein [Acidimicrobiales bacterium]
MGRPAGATVHVGKAAALIIGAFVLGFIVLNVDGTGGASLAVGNGGGDDSGVITNTTLGDDELQTTTTTVALRQPATVKVVAVNATSTAGIAGRATQKLQAAGYNALTPGNATAEFKATNPTSVVYVVTPGFEREAAAVAAVFALPASAVRAMPATSPSPDIKDGTNIAVIVGTGLTI